MCVYAREMQSPKRNASPGAKIMKLNGNRSVSGKSWHVRLALPVVRTARFSKVSVLDRLSAQAKASKRVIASGSKRASVSGSM